MTAPSILIVDDGELDRVQALVSRLQVNWVRCAEPDADPDLPRPRDLLITSGPRAMKLGELAGDAEPIWLCIYDQDFLPLRERLRDLGVHYLVSSDLAPRTFLLFLQQLLYRGPERRQVRRIPLECELEVSVAGARRRGLLLELSRESCVFSMGDALPEGAPASVRLPGELTGDASLDLAGRVLRSEHRAGAPDDADAICVLRFEALEADATARIQHILGGHALGTQVTPLCEEPGSGLSVGGWSIGDEPERGWSQADGERRGGFRRHHPRRVDAIRWLGDPGLQTVLARDISPNGLRVVANRLPEIGSEVTLALYGREREEPLLLGATVVWAECGEAGLRFDDPSPDQLSNLQRLLAASPCAEEIGIGAGAVHVAQLRPSAPGAERC